MYLDYFGLNEPPFSITPDPRFLFMSQRHREALAHLLYGFGEYGGFVQLTGEIGTGKTTLCRGLLDQASEGSDVALILNPRQTELELVSSICDELHVPASGSNDSLKSLVDRLNAHLLHAHARGRRTVVIIDEAQALSVAVLEQLRLLTNLETPTRKLLQIILIGQPELRDLLARPELRQLAQRITARYHLTPLSESETQAYVAHRLTVAGLSRPLFERRALRLVHKLSSGVPRLINVICDRALLAAYARQRLTVGRATVRGAAAEVLGGQTPGGWPRRFGWTAAGVTLVLAGTAVPYLFWLPAGEPPRVAQLNSPVAAVAAVAEPASEISLVPEPVTVVVAEPKVPAAPTGPVAASAVAAVTEPTSEISLVPEPVTVVMAEPRVPAAPTGPVVASAGEVALSTAEVDLDRALSDAADRTDTAQAFSILFDLWGEKYTELDGRTACERAASAGLGCRYERGSWGRLARYNRPAVLELMGSDGQRHHVVVNRLSESQVTLDLGGEWIEVPRGQLDPYWLGDFILFWRSPRPDMPLLFRGSRGADVVWLRTRLDKAEGMATVAVPSPIFDEGLRTRVQAFQRKRGLVVDGLVGTETVMQLQAAADSSAPSLRD